MKRGILFLNGEPPTKEEIRRNLSSASTAGIFCTDGAYEYLSAEALPDVVVGDFDSLQKSRVDRRCEIIEFPSDKDFTDGHLAVKIMIERGFTDIDIFGGYGGRPDMAECNFLLLALAHKLGARARLCGRMNTYLFTDIFRAKVEKGSVVSVAPFGDSVHILYTKGLKYALSDYTMKKFDNIESSDYIMGVSNMSVEENIEIALDGGVALVFVEESGR